MIEKIICNVCEEAGIEYKLSYGGVYPSTDIWIPPFVDDRGRRHRHDGNSGGEEYWRCSNGHEVTQEPRAKCWCGWPITGPYVSEESFLEQKREITRQSKGREVDFQEAVKVTEQAMRELSATGLEVSRRIDEALKGINK